jgi:hypothetical protein
VSERERELRERELRERELRERERERERERDVVGTYPELPRVLFRSDLRGRAHKTKSEPRRTFQSCLISKYSDDFPSWSIRRVIRIRSQGNYCRPPAGVLHSQNKVMNAPPTASQS